MKTFSKRDIQICLGALWLFDALLQAQPQMFTNTFANKVIAPAASGQPAFVSGPIHLGLHLFLLSPVIFNSLFVLTQLSIGLLILNKKTARLGLFLSVFWGALVWMLGEGYSGIFSGHALLLMGAPGAALIYLVLSLAVLPKDVDSKSNHSTPAYWLAIIWLVIWVGGALYQLLPGQNTTGDISSMLSSNSVGAPNWLSSLDKHSANFVKNLGGVSTKAETAQQMHMTNVQMNAMTLPAPVITKPNPGYLFIICFALLQIYIGASALLSGSFRVAGIWMGIIISLGFWVIGQNIGGLYSGLATDPSTGPLIILLGLVVLGLSSHMKLARLGRNIEKLMVGTKA